MQNNSPKPTKTAIKAIILHTFGAQVVSIALAHAVFRVTLVLPTHFARRECGVFPQLGLPFRVYIVHMIGILAFLWSTLGSMYGNYQISSRTSRDVCCSGACEAGEKSNSTHQASSLEQGCGVDSTPAIKDEFQWKLFKLKFEMQNLAPQLRQQSLSQPQNCSCKNV